MLAIAVLFAGAPAGALPAPPPGPFVGHAPILIQGDANFTAANGVVAGTGSPGDPYVIAGWSISAASGVGIEIKNVTKAFVIRNDLIAAGFAIVISQTSSIGVIDNNQLTTMGTGISVTNADAVIVNNSFVGDLRFGGGNHGIDLVNSNSRVESNAFIYTPFGIIAYQGSPIIRCNDIHDDSVLAGVSVRFTTNATIECNTFTSCATGIVSLNAIGTVIANNSISQCALGIDVTLTKDAVVVNNTVRASAGTQVRFWHTSGNFSSNVIIDGKADAVIMEQSPMLVSNNTIRANARVGLWLMNTAADVSANVISHNSVGIFLDLGSIPHLTANVVTNNTVGLDVPYSSRQAILSMSANLVNGVNVDGTLNASAKVLFYQAANVTITGQVRDSGFSAGYYGSLTAQGNVVLYEVDTALVSGTLLSHANAGVTATNSFNVVIQGSVITDTLVGVSASAQSTGQQVPACAVSVKNTTINITVDPVGTIGVSARGCLTNVFNSSISTVSTGIALDADSTGEIRGNLITHTTIGLDISARSAITVSGNTVTLGNIGARFSGSKALVTSNLFTQLIVGAQLTGDANLTFQRNNITASGEGVVDLGPCAAGFQRIVLCGSLQAKGNTFADNDGDGLRINGSSRFSGDVFSGNGGTGARLASAVMLGVTATRNGGDGVSLSGTFTIRDSTFSNNSNNGASLAGQGDIRRSEFSRNTNAGIHSTASFLSIIDSNLSFNFDGIALDDIATLTSLPSVSTTTLLRALPNAQGTDTLDIHRSTLLRNERDAIRAGIISVNATQNYWGGGPPSLSVLDTVGAFQNGVSPLVRFVPWYTDAGKTTTGPVAGL